MEKDSFKFLEKVNMCKMSKCAPIPQDGIWTNASEIKDINGFSHGVGTCAPQQGACKLTINVKDGIIVEALVETVGCSGMTHSAAMAGEILVGKTILEALNTDLVCDAINKAMQEVFLQLVYGRSQSAYSLGGLEVGSAMEDLGKYKSSQLGTIYSTLKNGPRYLNLTEGYVLRLGLDKNDEIIGYEYINLNSLIEKIKDGIESNEAYTSSIKTYGRFNESVKQIDPRRQ